VAEASGVAPLRVTGAVGQMLGAMFVRHVVGLEPMASADEEELVWHLAPILEYCLDSTAMPGGRTGS
jgi:hypothetical protein